MTISNIRQLTTSDKSEVEVFLKPNIEQTLFLQYNIYRGGLAYSGKPGQSIFFGVFHNEKITSVISLSWNGHVQIFAPHTVEELCKILITFLKKQRRKVIGINGPTLHVKQAIQHLDLAKHPKSLDSDETLYTLLLENLHIPALQNGSAYTLRKATANDLDMLVEWQIGYAIEALGSTDTRELRKSTQKRIEALIGYAGDFVRIFEVDGVPVSRTNITASTPEAVMLGGIWTPSEYRNKGYARLAVATHLLEIKRSGINKAVLFTNSPAAKKAYTVLGFKEVGDFSLILFETPWMP